MESSPTHTATQLLEGIFIEILLLENAQSFGECPNLLNRNILYDTNLEITVIIFFAITCIAGCFLLLKNSNNSKSVVSNGLYTKLFVKALLRNEIKNFDIALLIKRFYVLYHNLLTFSQLSRKVMYLYQKGTEIFIKVHHFPDFTHLGISLKVVHTND